MPGMRACAEFCGLAGCLSSRSLLECDRQSGLQSGLTRWRLDISSSNPSPHRGYLHPANQFETGSVNWNYSLFQVADRPEPVSILKFEIESREIPAISMMPVGGLINLNDMEMLDLFAYLQSTKQVRLVELKP